MSENIDVQEHEKVKKYLYEEILKRDKEIEKLKDENKLLLATSIKRSKELREIQEQLTSLTKK